MALPMFVSPCRLQRLLQENLQTVQLVDCRSFLQYSTDTIWTALNVFCPPLLRRRYPDCLPLETLLSKDTQQCLARPGLETIVLFDEDSDEVASSDSLSVLYLIQKSLLAFLGKKNYIFLSGGFSRFQRECRPLCTSRTALYTDLAMRITIEHARNSSSSTSSCESETSEDSADSVTSLQHAPVELLPYLFIGDVDHSKSKALLQSLSISSILNVSTSCPNHFPQDFRYKVIPVEDTGSADLSQWFREAIDFIESERVQGGKVLVHCRGGVSRSATICLAYLMFSRSLCLDDAFEYVKSRRRIISPNVNFMMQLSQFERQVLPSPNSLPVAKSPASPMSPCRLYSATRIPDLSLTFQQCDNESGDGDVDLARVSPSSIHYISPVVTTS